MRPSRLEQIYILISRLKRISLSSSCGLKHISLLIFLNLRICFAFYRHLKHITFTIACHLIRVSLLLSPSPGTHFPWRFLVAWSKFPYWSFITLDGLPLQFLYCFPAISKKYPPRLSRRLKRISCRLTPPPLSFYQRLKLIPLSLRCHMKCITFKIPCHLIRDAFGSPHNIIVNTNENFNMYENAYQKKLRRRIMIAKDSL